MVQRGEERFAIVSFRELIHKTLEIGVTRYHKRSNRYLQFFALRSQVQAPAGDLPVQAKAVLIISLAYFRQVGLPSVIIKICLLAFRLRRRISMANSSPATVLV